jgi:hypothetical protein
MNFIQIVFFIYAEPTPGTRPFTYSTPIDAAKPMQGMPFGVSSTWHLHGVRNIPNPYFDAGIGVSSLNGFP